MADQDNIIARINRKYSGMSKGHKAIASYIKSHYDQAAFLTAAKMGEKLHISESTVIRFAYGLGYGGYPQMQGALAAMVKGKLHHSVERVGAAYGQSTQSEILASVLDRDAENIRHTLGHLDPVSFETAVGLISEADTVYVLGIRSCQPLADFLAFYLQMIRENVVQIKTTSVSEIFEQMIRIGERDCMIGISFPRYSMRTLKAMEFANVRNAKVIAVTDSVHSPMNLYSSCNLLAKSDTVSIVDSLAAPLSLINALVVALCLKQPDRVRKNLETLEEVWNNYQVYMNDEMDYMDEEAMFGNALGGDE